MQYLQAAPSFFNFFIFTSSSLRFHLARPNNFRLFPYNFTRICFGFLKKTFWFFSKFFDGNPTHFIPENLFLLIFWFCLLYFPLYCRYFLPEFVSLSHPKIFVTMQRGNLLRFYLTYSVFLADYIGPKKTEKYRKILFFLISNLQSFDENILRYFSCVRISYLNHCWNETRLLSPEHKCPSCFTNQTTI